MINKKSALVLGCLCAFATLPSCGPTELAALGGYHAYQKLTEDAELIQRNYGAADYLVGRTKDFVSKSDLIVPSPLINVDYPDAEPTEFGIVMAEQLAARFAQLGYNIYLPDTAELPPSTSQIKDGISLKGTYKPDGYILTNGDVHITLRMVDNKSRRVVETFSYYVPLTYDVARAIKPPEGEVKVEAVPVEPVTQKPVPAPVKAVTQKVIVEEKPGEVVKKTVIVKDPNPPIDLPVKLTPQ